jgi:nucleotide-binding universal stress UspA family protein
LFFTRNEGTHKERWWKLNSSEKKIIVIPVDGSKNALQTIDYLSLIFAATPRPSIVLLHILPALPSVLTDEKEKDSKILSRIRELEAKSLQMADRIFEEAKAVLVDRGFDDSSIWMVKLAKQTGVAQDICHWSNINKADAILISTRGRNRIETFIMGETSGKVLEYAPASPVWLAKGAIKSKSVLLAIDGSDYSLRAAAHAGSILKSTDCDITIFHSCQSLRRFVPKELFSSAPEVENLWKIKTAKAIEPFIRQTKNILLSAGLERRQIFTKVIGGSRDASVDILEEAVKNEFGTIVLGRRGLSGVEQYRMRSVTRKIVDAFKDGVLWIVP